MLILHQSLPRRHRLSPALGAHLFGRVKLLSESEIIYRDFWDVPRLFIVLHLGRHYLFDCPFNSSVEDFEQTYHVYTFPDLPEGELGGSWEGLAEKAEDYLGEVPVTGVQFDPSKRRIIDTSIIDELRDKIHGGAVQQCRT